MEQIYCNECLYYEGTLISDTIPEGECRIRSVASADWPPRGPDDWCGEGIMSPEEDAKRKDELQRLRQACLHAGITP